MPPTTECTRLFNQAMRVWWEANGTYVCAKCQKPGSETNPLEVSHFFNVRMSGTRFDPDNVDPLHRGCHTGSFGRRNTSWEYQKREGGAYWVYMIKKLGPELFNVLRIRAHKRMSLEMAKAELMHYLKEGTLCRRTG